jgi:hypothetical protein
MNSDCQAIAAAKHNPKVFRLRNSQRLNGPGNSARIEDAPKARYSEGIAHRTESWIMEETPGPEDKSVRIIAMIMAMDIGPVMNQNNLHLLMVFVFNTSSSSTLINFRHSWKTTTAGLFAAPGDVIHRSMAST